MRNSLLQADSAVNVAAYQQYLQYTGFRLVRQEDNAAVSYFIASAIVRETGKKRYDKLKQYFHLPFPSDMVQLWMCKDCGGIVLKNQIVWHMQKKHPELLSKHLINEQRVAARRVMPYNLFKKKMILKQLRRKDGCKEIQPIMLHTVYLRIHTKEENGRSELRPQSAGRYF